MPKLSSLCFGSTSHPRQPESKWSWLVCAAGSFAWALSFGMVNSYAVVMPVMMNQFRSSREATGTMRDPSIDSSIHLSILLTNQSINQSVNYVDQSVVTNQSINVSINP